MTDEIRPQSIVSSEAFGNPSVEPARFARASELQQLRADLADARILAVVGPGGIGKTTLASQLARSASDEYPGGIQLVEGYSLKTSVPRPDILLGDTRQQPSVGRSLLIIDGLDALPTKAAEDLLRAARLNETYSRIVVTSRSAVEGADVTRQLRPLSDEESKQLLSARGIGDADATSLAPALGGNPLAITLAANGIREGSFTAHDFLTNLRAFHTTGIIRPDGRGVDTGEAIPYLRVEIPGINDDLLRSLERDIDRARDLSPRKFEELVAELLTRLGYRVELTPASRDGGKDIYVAKREDLGTFLYLVECKRYALDNPVGVEVVRSLYGTVQAEHATAGILVTTSVFTRGAADFQRTVRHQVSLRDYIELHRWIRQALRGAVA